MISPKELFLVLFLAAFSLPSIIALKEGDCEVCINVINKFSENLSDDVKKDPKKIEIEFRKYCKASKGKENRFVSKNEIG
jgi:mesencephalic astrocyte-derived neurotrophic factor